jgi:hypothetical protein
MRLRKASPVLAAVAVGGALVLGGCGGGGDSTTSAQPEKATTPASQVSNGGMKHEDAMTGGHGDAMNGHHSDGAMHDGGEDHGGAMMGH